MLETITIWQHAAEHAASHVYHNIIALNKLVSQWDSEHPEIQPLLVKAGEYFDVFLVATGVPSPAVPVIHNIVVATLKRMAAHDTTVVSG